MTVEDFCFCVLRAIDVGTVFRNPGGGTSIVLDKNNERIVYLRGHTKIALKLDMLYHAYERFRGSVVTTRMLKDFDNSFDSSARNPAGHSCNCTFSFLVLEKAGYAGGIITTRPMSQHWF